MTELLNNTLEILCRLSGSSAGFISMVSEESAETIAFVGEINESDGIINDFLHGKYSAGETEIDSVSEFDFIKNLNFSSPVNSFFVKKLLSVENKKEFFLVLVSSEISNYGDELNPGIIPVINILIEKLKLFKKNKSTKNDQFKLNKDYILKYNRGFFELFLEVSEDLIFILDQEGCFVMINEFGAASIDYGADEMIGKHFLQFISNSEKTSTEEAINRIIEYRRVVTFETNLISKFGREIIFEISGNSIIENNRIAGLLGIAKNITEFRGIEEKIIHLNTKLIEANRIISIERQRSKRQKSILYELNNMKSNFVSNISHELRTPLASIIGFAETIASDKDMQDELKREFNQIILTEAKRLAKLINDVLDVSRIESGELKLNIIESDIIGLLNKAIENNRKSIEKKNILLTLDLQQENFMLKLDEERMLQVLNGLINNAVKFTDNKGRITISAREYYKEFEITISDTGIGIPAKDLPYIFQKFYRVNRPGMEIPGAGLGLVFVKQIVDLHKGFISILSDTSKGTTVILKLPKTSK